MITKILILSAAVYPISCAIMLGIIRRRRWWKSEQKDAAVLWPIYFICGFFYRAYNGQLVVFRFIGKALGKIAHFVEHGPRKKVKLPKARTVKE